MCGKCAGVAQSATGLQIILMMTRSYADRSEVHVTKRSVTLECKGSIVEDSMVCDYVRMVDTERKQFGANPDYPILFDI